MLPAGRDEAVAAPEDAGSGLQGFGKSCSKGSLITYFISAISFPTSLQSSLRKLP